MPSPTALKSQYDIAIIGGGMVGASLAVGLLPAAEELGLKVALFESVPLPSDPSAPLQPSYDARSTALSYGSRSLLQVIGVWPALADKACAIEHIQVSDRGHIGQVNLDAATEQVDALGYVIENRALGQALWQKLNEQSLIDVFCPAQVSGLTRQAEQMCLALSMNGELDVNGSELSTLANLVVMADGGRSELREQMGIEYDETGYEQHALIANVSLDRPHGGRAYERFTVDGPMALLPLIDDAEGNPRCALVWTTPEDEIDVHMSWTEAEFLSHLQEQFGHRAGRFVHVGERHAYPLKLAQAREQIRPGLAVLGNAAHTLHPIAGQGFNLALRGALTLAETLIETAVAQQQSLGSITTLQAFQHKLEWDQHKTIGFSDKVTRLFSSARPEVAAVRNLGLTAMEFLPPVKRLFSHSAMGMDMPLPQLQPSHFQTVSSKEH